MTASARVRIARIGDLDDGRPLGVHVDDVQLVVVRRDGDIGVFDGICPHQGNLLGDGRIVDGRLVCAGHGWRFDCASGAREGFPDTCLHRFDARIVDGDIVVPAAELHAFGQRRGGTATGVRPFASLPGPKGVPLIGNLFQLRETSQHLVMEDWADRYGPLYRIRLGPYRILMVADPHLVEEAFKRRPDTFRRMSTVEGIARGLKAAGVFTAEGDEWRRQRKVVVQALTHGHLKHFFPAMMRIVDRLRRRWERAADAGRDIDLLDDLTRFTIDVTSTFAFGQDLNTIEGHEGMLERQVGEIPKALSRRVTSWLPYWKYVKLPADRALDRALVGIHDTLGRLIADARRRLAQDPGLAQRPGNYIETLVAQSIGDGGFSDEDVTGNVMTLMLAGEETTARALAWLIYFMCERGDLLDALRAESDAVLGDEPILREFSEHVRMRAIEAAAHEAMRLKPAAPVLRLEALHDTVLGGVGVPAKTPVFLLTRHSTIREQAQTGAAAFDLGRWLDHEGGIDLAASKAFFPFGAGPRFCPGRFLALLEIKAVISMLCRNFELRRTDRGPVEECLVFTMRPDNLTVRLARRGAAVAQAGPGPGTESA